MKIDCSHFAVTSAEQEEAARKHKQAAPRQSLQDGSHRQQQLEQLYEKKNREAFRRALVDILLYFSLFISILLSFYFFLLSCTVRI